MNEPIEDLSVSMPAGCEAPVDDPTRPGVRLGELRHNRGPIAKGQSQDPAWLKGLVIGVLALIALPVSIVMFGVLGPVIGLLVLILIVLGVIAGRLKK
jgi:hypothetical protein